MVSEEDLEKKKELFKESDSRKLDTKVDALPGQSIISVTIGQEQGSCPQLKRVAFRSFDRQWIIPDNRLIHRPSPDLWTAQFAENQLYITEQHSQAIDSGPAVAFASLIPDMHHFNVRGGRVLPLLHPDGSPNVAPGLLGQLGKSLGFTVAEKDLVAYIAGVTAHPAFTKQFTEELVTPGIRVPITTDSELWSAACEIGRQVVWASTYGEVFVAPDGGRPKGNINFDPKDSRRPKNFSSIGSGLPAKIAYVPAEDGEGQIKVGQGLFGPVTERMWNYDVGGMNVISKWFSYRKADPGGKKTSPLDNIHLDSWPKEWITEFNELLTALRRVTELEEAQSELLEKIVAGPILTFDELKAKGVKFPQENKDRKPRYDLGSTATQDGMF